MDLSRAALEVVAVASGRREALQVLRATQPQVVVMNFSVNPAFG
jgi:CheY-like chemotaxis protein